MAILVDWYDEARRIVIWHYKDQWTWEELYKAGEESDKLFATTDQRVDVIMVSHKQRIPLGAFQAFDSLADAQMPENLGLIIIVGSSSAGETMVKISTKMNSVQHWKLVETLEQADALIMKDRQQNDTDHTDPVNAE